MAWRHLPWKCLILLAIALAASRHAAAAPGSILGEWLTQDQEGVIGIARCGNAYCGRIIGMSPATTTSGGPLLDHAGQPQCGLTILHVAPSDTAGQWRGHITDPDDGKVYDSQVHVDAQGRLHLRGYLLLPLFGQTQLWTRYTGHLTAGCHMIG
jgi:uncharacterized protein (DUF2147 family)